MIKDKCPLCGTSGRIWNHDPEVFVCPNCQTLFSEFGLLLEFESKSGHQEMWS